VRLFKYSMLAVIGLVLSMAVSATTIQSNGDPTVNSKVFSEGYLDFTEQETQETLVSANGAVFSIVSTTELRSPDFTLSSADDKQVLELTSIDSKLTDLIYEVGWQA